jgi:hypothetical protein
MLIPGGLDLKEVEDDIRVIEARLDELKAKKVKMPWERKEEKNLKITLGKLQWRQVSMQEHVRANPTSSEIYEQANRQHKPSPEDDQRRLLALKMNSKLRKKI